MIGIGATLFKTAILGGRFSPASLFSNGEIGVWYDPSDLSSMFKADQTTPAEVGQPVGKINDKSGNGYHAVQTVESKCPILQLSAGLYFLDFDGIDDGLQTSANIPFGTNSVVEMSVFGAAQKNTTGNNHTIAELSNNLGSVNGAFRLLCTTSEQWRSIQKGTIANTLTSSAVGNPNKAVVTSVASITAPSHLLNVDGTLEASNTATLGTGTYLDHPLNVGARNGGTAARLDGNIYGLIVRGKVSTSKEIESAEKYLAAKSGVAL